MNIDDVPDLKGSKYPERILLAVSTETKRKLEKLKAKKKSYPDFLRRIIDKALDEIAI